MLLHMAFGRHLINYEGKEYGALTVLERVGTYIWGRHGIFKVRCECGKESVVSYPSLRRQGIHCSCGKRNRRNEPTSLPSSLKIEPREQESSFNGLYNSYKRGAEYRGYGFTLSKEDFMALTKQNCFYCKSVPVYVYRISHSSFYLYNGIDRLNNNKGYEKGNIVACCGVCNRMKGTMGYGEFRVQIGKISASFKELMLFCFIVPQNPSLSEPQAPRRTPCCTHTPPTLWNRCVPVPRKNRRIAVPAFPQLNHREAQTFSK